LAIVQKITELVRALENKDLSQVKQIISSNIDEFAYWHDFSGNTIFHYAAKIGWSEGMSFLLTISKFESLINTRNNCDNTPLHIAMNLALTHNNFDIVNLLIEHGARTDIVGYLQGHYLTTNQMFLRSQAEAFARSQHLHLGEDSLAAGISCDVIKIIMGYLCQQP
jgi:ankyrin repeat protein